LAAKHLRAIGRARDRFAEDKLRMLRAVRFAAAFGFVLDEESKAAIVEMAGEIRVVSPERIAMEMRRLLGDRGRSVGVRLLVDVGLAAHVLPEIVPGDKGKAKRLDTAREVLERLGDASNFPLALAVLLRDSADAAVAENVCRRWRLSNKETQRVAWLVKNHAALATAQSMARSKLQPFLLEEGIDDLLQLMEATSSPGAESAAYCRSLLAEPKQKLNPPPLVTGNDLLAEGIPSGPHYKQLLERLRDAQLDGEVATKAEAVARAKQWKAEDEDRD
jgi:tRNA nucleotidyltransferase/poly(A) polymerase